MLGTWSIALKAILPATLPSETALIWGVQPPICIAPKTTQNIQVIIVPAEYNLPGYDSI